MPYLRGRVEHVLHASDTYHVLSFQVDETDGWSRPKTTKISGHFYGLTRLSVGAVLQVDGDWTTHPKYGRQFTAQGWQPWSKTPRDIERFLGECMDVFENKELLHKVVRHFGDKTFEALLDDTLPGLVLDAVEKEDLRIAQARWRIIRGIASLADSLREYNLGSVAVSAIFQKFGLQSMEVISENPYRLLEIEGFLFIKADSVGLRRGIGASDPRRVAGAVLWVIRDQIRQQGHLYIRHGDLEQLLNNLVGDGAAASFDSPDLCKAIYSAVEMLARLGAVKIAPDVGVYTPETFHYEQEAATMLSQFITPSNLTIDLEAFLTAYEVSNGIQLSDLQRDAVSKLIANRVLVVTGAPGTGKTTLIRTFVQLFQNLGISVQLMAPTGIAAKRLASVTEVGAQTIHRALKYDGFSWGKCQDEKLETQAVIVDETSMVDQELFYRLLDALTTNTLLVFVGDDAQLPSVGAGNVLRELLACPAVQHVRLEHVFRQAETSDIVLAAHKIRKGSSPLNLPPKEDSEFRFLKVMDEVKLASFVVDMAAKLKSRDANFQVLAPKYDGTVGVDNLNKLLRDRLNPDEGQPSWAAGSLNVRVGDRIMVIKNNYVLNVYNGDIGKLISIHKDHLKLRIHGVGKTPDTQVEIPKVDAVKMLKLAYAVTVHRCQGEEFETVVLPLVRSQGRMLQRNLFYTALTRARKRAWILGDPDAVERAVANDKVVQRNTQLRNLIRVIEQSNRD